MADWTLPREDLSQREYEGFRPPRLERPSGLSGHLRIRIRRFVDLQFGSIWLDMQRLLPLVRGTLADVGCGAQPFRDLLPADVHYVPIDKANADQHFGYQSPDTLYFDGDVLPLADAQVDVVLCTETLEHVLAPREFMRELARVLVPGGHLIATIPFAARWHFVPHDYWRYTPSALKFLLTAAGFRNVRVYARGGVLTVCAYKVLGLVLVMLSGGGRPGPVSWICRVCGIALLPLAVLAAVLGNIGLIRPRSVEDTLGYTILASKAEPV